MYQLLKVVPGTCKKSIHFNSDWTDKIFVFFRYIVPFKNVRPDFHPLEPLLGHKQQSHPSHLALVGGQNWAVTKRLLAVNTVRVGMPFSSCERR